MGPSVTTPKTQDYVLGRSEEEYERLRAQARIWEPETSRLLDRVGLAEGARCLDAGCGPGETMRLMAQRVGLGGQVRGVDVDRAVGAQAAAMLRDAGHTQCEVVAADLEDGSEVPGGPYDLVYARLLLLHVADPIAVLRRLWDAVAPGGHLVVHEHNLATTEVLPSLDVMTEWRRVALGAFAAAGRDLHLGHRLPNLFVHAGIGTPDGTDVAGRLEPMSAGGAMAIAVFTSLLPAAIAFGLTTPEGGSRWVQDFTRATVEHPDHTVLWPLMVGAWKRKPEGLSGIAG